MGRPRREIRDGKAWCSFHATMEPVEDFDWHSYKTANGSVRRLPEPNCALAKQTLKDQGKENDPAGFAIGGRAKSFAGQLSKALGQTVATSFVLVELNWQALIGVMDGMLSPRGRCLNCGRHRPEAPKLHIEHRFPPFRLTDWPAQHARNLWIACGGCNVQKGRSDADRDWLDQEMRKWMLDREWARHAGEKGWPPYEPSFGEVPLFKVEEQPIELVLFDRSLA